MADSDDLIKNAGKFFSKLGGTLRDAGSQIKQGAKQVTGIGRGKVRVELDQTKVAPGGTLRGRVHLALEEPVDGKRLVVVLRARQKIVTIGKQDGNRTVGTSHADVYELTHELGSAQRYAPGTTLPFELVVPPDALELRAKAESGNPLADAVRTVASALSPSAGPIEWHVASTLQIAWGRDLSSSVDIVVAR